jgi:hypothetical protein
MKAKIGVLAVVALMLLVAVPAISAGPFENARDRSQTAKEVLERGYTDWLSARADFLQAKVQWKQNHTAPNLWNLVNKAKIALLNADNVMIKQLEMLRAKVEATRGLSDNVKTAIYAEIDSNISWLQAEQTAIQNADNQQEVRSVASALENYWLNTRIEIKQIDGQILIAETDALVQKAEAFTGLVEARIQQLKDNGVDTSALENLLANYNSKLGLAEQKYDAAKAKFSQISSVGDADQLFRDGVALIKEGNSYLRDAFGDLRDIVSDMRNGGWPVTLTGSGTLIARGSGSAYISGTGLIKIENIQNSAMTVSPNAHVKTVGGASENLENGDVKYQGFSWTMVTGTDITTSLSGDNIVLYAHGRGTVTLTGTGTYRTYGEDRYVDGSWKTAGVTENLETGEAG